MAFVIAGGVLLGAAILLDLFFRERMADLGHRTPALKGGAFDYAEYHRIRVQQGWAAWPVWAMWTLYVCGIGLLIAGFFVRFGTRPPGIK